MIITMPSHTVIRLFPQEPRKPFVFWKSCWKKVFFVCSDNIMRWGKLFCGAGVGSGRFYGECSQSDTKIHFPKPTLVSNVIATNCRVSQQFVIQQMSLIFVFLKWQILWMNTLSMKLRSSWSPWPCWSLRAGHQSTRSRAGQRAFTAHQHSQVSHQQLSMNAATKWLRYGGSTHFMSQILATLVKVSQEPHSGFTVKHE